MEKTSKFKSNKKIIQLFVIIEFLSATLVYLFDFSLNRIVLLMIINLILIVYFTSFTNKYISKGLGTKEVYNEIKSLQVLVFIISGAVMIVIGNIFSKKIYGFGGTFIIFSVIAVLLQQKHKKHTASLKKLPVQKSKEYFIQRSFFTSYFLIMVPLLIDIHYNLLLFPLNWYYIFLGSYFIIVYSLTVMALNYKFSYVKLHIFSG